LLADRGHQGTLMKPCARTQERPEPPISPVSCQIPAAIELTPALRYTGCRPHAGQRPAKGLEGAPHAP
jgi:hypothetical protein